MITIQALKLTFANLNYQLFVAICGLIPYGLLTTIFEFDFPLVIPMKAAIQVYIPRDVSTVVIELSIIVMASTLAYLLFKVSKNNCETTLLKAKEVMSELDIKMEALDINSRFINKTLGLAKRTCSSYNELLSIINTNKLKEDDFALISSAVSKRLTTEGMKIDIEKSKEILERVNLAITESELEL